MGESKVMLKIIKTFDGSPALRNNCRHIKGEFYETNRQCFIMSDGKWHRVNNGKIVYDHETSRWELKGSYRMMEGIVSIKDGKDIIGYFSGNPEKNTKLVSIHGTSHVLNYEILLDNPEFIESPNTGFFYSKEYAVSHPEILRKNIRSYNLRLNYSAADYIYEFSKVFSENANITLGKIESQGSFFKELDGIRFGFEFETWNGTIPERLLKPAGLIPLRDGSLSHNGVRSYEYATIPMSGLTGLKGLKNSCSLLTEFTTISPNCSTHVHISGYKPTKEFVVTLYTLAKLLEDDIFSLFPKWFEDTSNFKGKNYCGRLPNLKINSSDSTVTAFDKIYNWLVVNPDEYPFEGFNTHNHPRDPGENSKWNVDQR